MSRPTKDILPRFRRGRGWRLYAEDGRRYLDLWQDGGRSILGAKFAGLGVALKAGIDRGLDGPFDSPWTSRLQKAIHARWPGYATLRLYRNESEALAALDAAALLLGYESAEAPKAGTSVYPGLDGLLASDRIHDPARSAKAETQPEAAGGDPCGRAGLPRPATLLRPFSELLAPIGKAPLGIPLLPCPRAFAPSAILFADAALAEALPESGLIAPVQAMAACAAIAALARYENSVGEKTWKEADKPCLAHFLRKGPYLYPRSGGAAYEALRTEARGRGIILSPVSWLPSILPGEFDDGELAPLGSISLGDGQ